MIRKIIASIALLVGASFVFAADTTLTDLTTSRLPTGGVFKVTTDEKLTTLTVNKITVNTQTVATAIATDLKVNGDITIGAQNGFTGVVTNKMSGYTNFLWIGEGVVTNVTLTGALP